MLPPSAQDLPPFLRPVCPDQRLRDRGPGQTEEGYAVGHDDLLDFLELQPFDAPQVRRVEGHT